MMGLAMPDKRGRDEAGLGEQREQSRRKRFWGTLGGLAVMGGITGLVARFAIDTNAAGAERIPALKTMPWLVYLGLAIFVAAFVGGSWKFFRDVDELELADNLWASMMGLYAYAIMLPVWWVLWQLDMAGEPDQWAIYAATLIAAAAVYFYRKLRLR